MNWIVNFLVIGMAFVGLGVWAHSFLKDRQEEENIEDMGGWF